MEPKAGTARHRGGGRGLFGESCRNRGKYRCYGPGASAVAPHTLLQQFVDRLECKTISTRSPGPRGWRADLCECACLTPLRSGKGPRFYADEH